MSETAGSNSGFSTHGAIAVIQRDEKFLVIQRADEIRAGGLYCFPGGGIEPGETSKDAVIRELAEELGVQIKPIRKVWECKTSWSVDLTWWLVDLDPEATFQPDSEEVQWVGWKSLEEMKAEPKMLSSNLEFIAGVESGEIEL